MIQPLPPATTPTQSCSCPAHCPLFQQLAPEHLVLLVDHASMSLPPLPEHTTSLGRLAAIYFLRFICLGRKFQDTFLPFLPCLLQTTMQNQQRPVVGSCLLGTPEYATVDAGKDSQTQDFLGPPGVRLRVRRKVGDLVLILGFTKLPPQPLLVGLKTTWGQPTVSHVIRLSLESREINCYYYG